MKIAIRTINGHYLTAVGGGGIGDPNGFGIPILTSATSVGPTEIFTLQPGYSEADSGAGSVAIQCPNGHFLTAVNGGGMPAPAYPPEIPTPLITTAKTIGTDETFELVPAGQPGQYAIRTASGYYLTAVGSVGIGDPPGVAFNTYPVHTNAAAPPNLWETMDFINVGSYRDTFEYLEPPTGPDSNSFNNWYWEMYPQPQPPVAIDEWAGFQFGINAEDASNPNALCSRVLVNANPAAQAGQAAPYQDSEIFNNGCNAESTSNAPCSGDAGGMQPPCSTPFPNGRLTTVQPPYTVTNSCLDSGGMFLQNPYGGEQIKNTPYYPSEGFPYCVEMRVKANGPTYGTRGWGFWNTIMPPSPNVHFAWFWEFGIHFDLSDNPDNSVSPLVFPVALTTNGTITNATLLWVDYYVWHDYKIIWAKDSVEYFIDGQRVATHNAAPYAVPPIGFRNGGMAYHCWVDNRLFNTVSPGGYCPIALPMEKSNDMQSFKAHPHKRTTSDDAPPVEAITVSEESTDFSKVLTKLTEVYLKQSEKKITKQLS